MLRELLRRMRAWRSRRRIDAMTRRCPRRAQHGTEALRRGADLQGTYTFRKCGYCGLISDYHYTHNV